MERLVVETCRGVRENLITPAEADETIALFEGDDRFVIRRKWDAVSSIVSIFLVGRDFAALSYAMPLD